MQCGCGDDGGDGGGNGGGDGDGDDYSLKLFFLVTVHVPGDTRERPY